jgi:rRNA maturation protein Nop10
MGFKKFVTVVGLVVVIIAAVAFAKYRLSDRTRSKVLKAAQQALARTRLQKIDNKTFEIFSETVADWNSKYAPDAEGHYKNPKTGEYTMMPIHRCASCGAMIPEPDMPSGWSKLRGQALKALMRERREFLIAYKCPKCGKKAYMPEYVRCDL